MSFEISQERPKPKLWLAKPNKQIIQRLNGIENLSGKFNFMNENELTFNINSYVFDEKTQEQKKNPALSKIRNKYLLKFTYNGQEEWFIIDSKTDTAEEKDYIPITARYIGSELDQKQVGTVEEIGKTIRDMMNQFLPVVAKNWSVRYIDDKLASVQREYNLTDASIGSILAEISEQTDAVIVFHNKDRQLSFIHKDNAGKFRGLKVKETTYLKSFTDAQNSQDLVTRLILEGKEGLSINSINPAGTSYIDDFSYYLKPFRRDSRRNVIEHSDYMSDELSHALLDFNEYFENRQGEYEELSESYTKLLTEQLEEDFKLSEITATLNNLEERIEVLQPIDGYAEKTVRGNTSFNVDYNMHYMMLVYNQGSLARVTFEDEEHLIMPNEYKYIKIKTPKQVGVDDELLTYPLNVLASNPNLVVGLSNSSEADFEEDDIDELDKKYNVYKYRELYAEQYAIVASIEKRVDAYNTQRQNINESLSAQSFFTPQLQEELENFTHWGVWREENHTDPKELLEDGREQLSERNNIDRTTTVNIIDFVQSLDPEDQKNWDKLVAGDKIRFSSETYEADLEAFISELNINFDENDVSLTLSDVIDLRDKARGASQVLASFVSTSNQVNMQKKQLDENAGKTNQVMALLEAEWDANKRRILAGNETVDIGSHGIRITSPTHPNEMLVAVAGVISISDDYGETFKQAINTRGVVAERLIGKVILGTELVMENNSGTFRFDDDGVRINADHFHLIADDGEDYFDNLMKQLEQEFVTYEERIKADMEQQEESFKNEISDVSEGLEKYTDSLLDTLADGVLTQQEINMLKMQMNMLEADYAQARRRIIPIIQSTDVDIYFQEQLYQAFQEFEKDYEILLDFINNLNDPDELSSETIQEIKELLSRFKPGIEEIIALSEINLEHIQTNRIANAEYNSRTFAENLMHDLEDEIGDLNDALEGFDLGFEGAVADGVLDMVERANISDALLRVESEKANVDNRYATLSVHKFIVNTDQLTSLQTAKQAYNTAFNNLINRINYVLAREKITPDAVEEYKTAYEEFASQIVNYSQVYEESLEFVQNRYADTQRGEAEKYADGLKKEVDDDIADVQDNISNFADDVYGAFADGIITERERARLQIHHDMIEKEKSDVIERYNTIITSQYLQGFYDTETLVQARARYGEIHADLLLDLELAMMDDKITKEEADQAVTNFEEYVGRLTAFSLELELAIAALGESKAVYQTKEELKNYIELSVFNDEVAKMQSTLDGHIMTWYYDHEPTLNNEPAVNWTDSATRERHVGDLFYYGEEGFAYRFMKKPGGGFKWTVIKDNDITKALADAQDAIDLADSKRRVFVADPTTPYDIGDLWIMDDGELMRARRARKEGEAFLEGDWILATKYTDDTKANAVENMLNDFQEVINGEFEDLVGTFDAFQETIEGAFKDGIIEEYELKILQTQAQSLDREKADVDALYNQLLNRSELTSGERNTVVTRYNSFSSTHQTLVSGIRLAIEDGVISEEEYEATMRALEDYPEAVRSIKEYMNQLITDLINRVSKDAKDALEGVDRFDTWKSSSFEVDTEKIATRVGESSWKSTWQPIVEQGISDASEETEARIAQTNKELEDVKDSLSTFEDTITNSFKNGIIEEAEAKAIKSHKAQLSKEKKDIDQKYTTIYANSRLAGSAKTNLLAAKTAFNTSHSNLISAIDKAIADGKATTAEYNTVISGFGDYEAKLATLTYRFEEANDYIGSAKATSAETNAKTHADTEISKIEVGGRNLLRNSDFEKGTDFWQQSGGNTRRIDEDGYSGNGLRIVYATTGTVTPRQSYTGNFYSGDNLTASVKVKTHSGDFSTMVGRFANAFSIPFSYKKHLKDDWELYVFTTELQQDYSLSDTAFGFYRTLGEFTIDEVKLEKGNKATDWSPSPEDTQAQIDSTKEEVKDISEALENFEGDVTGFIKDGIIEEAEAKAIRVHLQQIDKEKEDIDKKYSEIYGNSQLTGSAKTNLLNAKTSFNSAHSNLKSYINSAILDDKVTSSEASTIDSRFSSYSSALSTLSQRLEQAVNAIASKYASDAESSAKKHADSKAQAAQEAAEKYAKTKAEAERVLAEAYADGEITKEEEARIADVNARLEEAKAHANEAASAAETAAKTHANIKAKAAQEAAEAYAKTKAEAERVLAEAHADGKVTAEEKARIADVNKKLAEAKAHADTTSKEAEDAAKGYADTEISKIEVGGRNLILNSAFVSEPYSYAKRYNILSRSYNELVYKNSKDINSGPMFEFSTSLEKGNYIISFDLEAEHETSYNYIYLRHGFKANKKGGAGDRVPSQKIYAGENNISISLEVNRDNLDGIWIGTNNSTEQTFVLKNLKLEKGNKATSWSPAPEDIENQFKMVNSNAYGLNEDLTKAFKDGIISEAEATAIGDSINLVKSDYENVMKRYTNVYANSGLTGTAKTRLLSARNAYNTSYNSLVNHITTVINSGEITDTQRATYNTRFSDYRNKIGVLSDAIESAWDAIVNKKSGDAADSAVTGFYNTEIKAKYSTTEQTKELLGSYVTSTELQGNLDKLSSGYSEHEVSNTKWSEITEANGSLMDDAFSYEITARRKTNDDTLYVAMFNSRGRGNGWDKVLLERKGTTGSHPLVYNYSNGIRIKTFGGSTLYAMQVVYQKYAGSFTNMGKTSSMIEQKAEEINQEVKKKVGNNEIISRINQSAEEISIDANKINLTAGSELNIAVGKMNNLSVGGRNLVLDSNMSVQTDGYLINRYELSDTWDVGQPYTLTIKGKIDSDQFFAAWRDNGSRKIGDLEYNPTRDVHTITFDAPEPSPSMSDNNRVLSIYNRPMSNGKNARIDWVKLEKGTMSSDWSQAPEDSVNSGGVNLIDTQDSTYNFSVASSQYNNTRVYYGLEKNTVYTFTANVDVLAGGVEEVAVLPWSSSTSMFVMRSPIKNGKIRVTFKTDSEADYDLLIYNGVNGQTKGNRLRYRNMKLEVGSYATSFGTVDRRGIISAINADESSMTIQSSKLSIKADDISIDGKEINIGYNPAIKSLKDDVSTARGEASEAQTQADAARDGDNIAKSINSSKNQTRVQGSRIIINGLTEFTNPSLPRQMQLGNAKINANALSEWGVTTISGGKIQTDQMTAKRIRVVRRDGLVSIDDGMVRADYQVNGMEPHFRNPTEGMSSNPIWTNGTWYNTTLAAISDIPNSTRSTYARHNAFYLKHNSRYVVIPYVLNQSISGSANSVLVQIHFFDGSGISERTVHRNLSGNENHSFKIDLGAPDFKSTRAFYIRFRPNTASGNHDVINIAFRPYYMTDF